MEDSRLQAEYNGGLGYIIRIIQHSVGNYVGPPCSGMIPEPDGRVRGFGFDGVKLDMFVFEFGVWVKGRGKLVHVNKTNFQGRSLFS